MILALRIIPHIVKGGIMLKRNFILLFLFLTIIIFTNQAFAEIFFSEGFEGPNDFKWYNVDHTETITKFVGSDFSAPYSTAKMSSIEKDTSIKHSGSASIRLYSSSPGGTSEFWSPKFSTPQKELWITWWERLSKDYDINVGHKWFLFKLDQSGGDSYLNWQAWDGSSNSELSSRIYNSGPVACSNQTFALTKSITLPTEKWYQYKIHIKLNDSNSSNGIFNVWVKRDNSTWTPLWSLSNVKILCNTYRGIIALRFGGTRSTSIGDGPSRGTKWIDDIKVGRSEADVEGSTSSTSSNSSNSNPPPHQPVLK